MGNVRSISFHGGGKNGIIRGCRKELACSDRRLAQSHTDDALTEDTVNRSDHQRSHVLHLSQIQHATIVTASLPRRCALSTIKMCGRQCWCQIKGGQGCCRAVCRNLLPQNSCGFCTSGHEVRHFARHREAAKTSSRIK